MAITVANITLLGRNVNGDVRNGNQITVTASIVPTGSYSTGGEVPTGSTWEAALNMDVILNVKGHLAEGGPPPTTLWVCYWNFVTKKLQVFGSNGASPAALAEKTAATYGTAPIAQLTFVGR